MQPNAAFGSCYNTAAVFQTWTLAPTLLASTLFVVSANWHRLQRRFDQTECDTQVMQPVLNFLFHGAPFRVMPGG